MNLYAKTSELACCDGDDNEWDDDELEEERLTGNGLVHRRQPENQVIELLSDDTESDEVMASNEHIDPSVAMQHGDMANGDGGDVVTKQETKDKQTEFMRYPPK